MCHQYVWKCSKIFVLSSIIIFREKIVISFLKGNVLALQMALGLDYDRQSIRQDHFISLTAIYLDLDKWEGRVMGLATRRLFHSDPRIPFCVRSPFLVSISLSTLWHYSDCMFSSFYGLPYFHHTRDLLPHWAKYICASLNS